MGMASSQARLLTLTARMHDIEYKAARLEAQKLQMANESTRVYEDYLRALDATSVQVGILGTDGSTNYINATLAILEGDSDINLNKSIYLVDSLSDKVYITKALADKYNLDDSGSVGSLEDFMANAGYDVIIQGYTTAANAISTTYTGVGVETDDAGSRIVSNLNSSMGYQAVTQGSHVYTTTNVAELDADTVSSIIANGAFDADTTYNISTAEELYQLLTLVNTNHIDTTGINFVLTDDIDLSGYNWTGIGTSSYQFKGIFDGNGYTISNLTGTNGLFAYVTGDQTSETDAETGVTTEATYGIVQNVCLENVNITPTSSGSGCGALIGKSTSAYVENCYTNGTINGTNWAGGLIGWNVGSAVESCTANVDLNCSSTCVGGLIGHDTDGIISNSVSTGSVKASGEAVGGFIGHETSSGDSFIYQCATVSSVSGSKNTGAFVGKIDSGCTSTVVESLYSSDVTGDLVACGTGDTGYTGVGNSDSLTDGATRTVDTIDVTLPTLESVESNIALLLEQAGLTDAVSDDDIQNWLKQFYVGTSDSDTISENVLTDDALKLASINEYICEALSSGGNSDLVSALIADITSGSTSNTVSYQDKFVPTREYEYTPYEADESELASKQNDLTIPSIENIAKNLYTALYNAGYSVSSQDDVDAIIEWMESNYSTDTDDGKLALANLNDYITNCINNSGSSSSELENIYNAIVSGTSYTLPESECTYAASDNNSYTITVADYEQTCEATYDMSNQNVIDAINFWEVAHKGGYIIVSDELANSNEWLTNMINSGTTVLVEVDKNKEVNNFETSVSTNTGLQEVSNEVMLKKAEAKYEADMKKIDLKDRKYDTDLAAIETEREAIKDEIDTLKTVAKDNVDRTFKLFS